MHPGACLFAEDPGRQLRARQAAARHDNPVHAAEAVASRRQSIAACKAHITMALNRDDIAKANKMVRQLGILHPDAKQEIEEQAKRVSRASGDQQQGLQAARELYVDMMTMEESKDRPFDRCGAFGCLLLDKQLRPRNRTPVLPPARTYSSSHRLPRTCSTGLHLFENNQAAAVEAAAVAAEEAAVAAEESAVAAEESAVAAEEAAERAADVARAAGVAGVEKRVSRASLGLAIRQAQDAVNVADEASTGSGLAVRHEQLHRQALPAERHVRFSVSEDSRPRSSSRLSTRATESAATEVSEDGAPVVSPARREPSLYPLLSFCHSLTLSLCLSLAYSPPPRLCPG